MSDEQKTKLIELKQKVNDLEFELDKIKNEFMMKIIIAVILIFFFNHSRAILFNNKFIKNY